MRQINWVGLKTLIKKEVRRFMRVPGQTVLSPLISTSLYFLVFGQALGRGGREVDGVPYLTFIVPGLVFLGVANNAFLNASSSLFITKIQGTVVDLLAAPLGPIELLCGFAFGAVLRGLMVGGLTYLVTVVFIGAHLARPLSTVGMFFLVSWVFAQLGILCAMWADKFEQVNFFPTFVMMPLTFLGGIFYSIDSLPEPWRTLSLGNPMVYMVETARVTMVGRGTMPTALAAPLLGLTAITFTAVVYWALRSGYKLKQ